MAMYGRGDGGGGALILLVLVYILSTALAILFAILLTYKVSKILIKFWLWLYRRRPFVAVAIGSIFPFTVPVVAYYLVHATTFVLVHYDYKTWFGKELKLKKQEFVAEVLPVYRALANPRALTSPSRFAMQLKQAVDTTEKAVAKTTTIPRKYVHLGTEMVYACWTIMAWALILAVYRKIQKPKNRFSETGFSPLRFN